jgi:hypothetical protein
MAVVLQTLNDGPRNHTVHMTILAANAAAVVVDASAWSEAADFPTCDIVDVKWSLTGAPATLLWDATANVVALELSAGEGHQNYRAVGGLPNSSTTGKTGDVLLTNAVGLTTGHITLQCRKRS